MPGKCLHVICLLLLCTAIRGINNDKQIAKLLDSAKSHLNNSMDLAVKEASQALLLAQQAKLPRETATAQLYLARGYHQAGVYDQALRRAQQALKGFEALKDDRGTADACEQLGNIYWRLEREKQVQEYYARALGLRRKLNDPAALADALNSWGIVNLHYLNKPEEALACYSEALQMSKTSSYKLGVAHSLNNLGNYYLLAGELDKSFVYNSQSLELYKELGDTNRLAINTLIIGYLYQLQGDEAKAEKTYFDVIQMAIRTQAPATIRDAYLNLAGLYEQQGKKQKHLEYYKSYAELADSILSSETNRNIANLQTQHEVEKKELENKILRLGIHKQRIILISLLLFCLAVLAGGILIHRERQKSEKLLLNILPRKVAKELKHQGYSLPQTFTGVSVLFSDFVDFTAHSTLLQPEELIRILTGFFTEFDILCERYGCERIKTIGDAYLAVCGLPQANVNHAVNILNLATGMMEIVKRYNESNPNLWQIRIGLHCGDVVGGIVGIKKYIYDVFGDTINTASRMESNSLPMRINVSEAFYREIFKPELFETQGVLEVKGKGRMEMYLLKPG